MTAMTENAKNIDNILGWNAPHIHFTIDQLRNQDTTDAPPSTIRMRRNEFGAWEREEA